MLSSLSHPGKEKQFPEAGVGWLSITGIAKSASVCGTETLSLISCFACPELAGGSKTSFLEGVE